MHVNMREEALSLVLFARALFFIFLYLREKVRTKSNHPQSHSIPTLVHIFITHTNYFCHTY